MEYCAGRTLNDLCRGTELGERQILDYLRQIVDGIRYLHEGKTPIFHGDIKGDSIFLTEDSKVCKLGDLENFQLLLTEKKVNDGTLRHLSHEMLEYVYGTEEEDDTLLALIAHESDIWSIGCTVLEMVGRGEVQFKGADKTPMTVEAKKVKTFLKQVKSGACPDQSIAERELSEKFSFIVTWCLMKEPSARPTAAVLQGVLDTMCP
ncbi:hypothetical protein BV898_19585 [Hypsibius exemplaris]|uniref:Protein kinase domain-containing protein n=1 Tax=Hypsibius exemplaris TaxID=2072580 RepID=A0A9X6NJD1_HYPEX|nr:hypothetical protein BV898_19585 [Hypsibius exemplaris]